MERPHTSPTDPAAGTGDEPVESQSGLASRRRFLGGSAAAATAAVVGAAAGAVAGRRTTVPEVPGDTSLNQQELRGNAFHGDLGIWPIIWSVPVTSNAVALTFDDGPDPEFTPRILEVLRSYSVPATFNMMGWNSVRHPDIVAAVVAGPHEIGNHSWTHQDLAKVGATTALAELRRGREAIEATTGRRLTFFRPPRGELSGVTLRYAAEQQQSILLWTVNGGLPTLTSAAAVARDLLGRVEPGYIVGMHDGIGRGTFDRSAPFAKVLAAHRTVEVAALPAIIEGLLSRGTRLTTVSGLLLEPRVPGRLTVSGASPPLPVEVVGDRSPGG